jgi:hypothetical protein
MANISCRQTAGNTFGTDLAHRAVRTSNYRHLALQTLVRDANCLRRYVAPRPQGQRPAAKTTHPRALPVAAGRAHPADRRGAADRVDNPRRRKPLVRRHAARGPPTIRAHAYGLLKTIMGTAVADGKATANPCVLKGAGSAKRAHKVKPATLPELEVLTVTLPERLRLMALLGAWCALRYGELTELRRHDVDLDSRCSYIPARKSSRRSCGLPARSKPSGRAGSVS